MKFKDSILCVEESRIPAKFKLNRSWVIKCLEKSGLSSLLDLYWAWSPARLGLQVYVPKQQFRLFLRRCRKSAP